MSKIPVVLITDAGYVVPTYIVCKTLVDSRNADTEYEIIIMDIGLTEEDKEKLNLLQMENEGVSLRVLPVSTEDMRNYGFDKTDRWPLATYIKFIIADVLTDYEKIIYLDGDMLVCQDLNPLYQTDITDVYLGAVRDRLYDVEAHEKRLRIAKGRYFNTGCMLLNLVKMREDAFSKKCIEAKQNDTTLGLADQDAYNVVCRNRVLMLPMKYNFYIQYLGMQESIEYFREQCICTYVNKDEMRKDVAVIHMIGDRPWNVPKADKEWIRPWIAECSSQKKKDLIVEKPYGYVTYTWWREFLQSPFASRFDSYGQQNFESYLKKEELIIEKKWHGISYKLTIAPGKQDYLCCDIRLSNITLVRREKGDCGKKNSLRILGIPMPLKILSYVR